MKSLFTICIRVVASTCFLNSFLYCLFSGSVKNQRVLVWAALGIVWILSGPPWNLSGKRHLGGLCVSVLPSCDLNGTSEVTTRSYVCLCCQVVTSAAPRRSQTRSFLCLCCQVVTSAAPRSSHTRSFVCLCCQVKPQRHFGGRKRDPLV